MKRLLLFITLALCSRAFADDAMFRANPQHTGVYDAAGVPQFTKIKWQFHTQGQILSSPAIVGGTVYVGSSDHFLYALDASSATLKWKFKTGSRITSSPAVSAGLVYFCSYDSNFYAVDVVTGQLKWKFQTGGEHRFAARHLHGAEPAAETMPDPFDFFLSSPVVWNGAVYFGSGDTYIYALDAASGAMRWKFKTGDVVHASPAISSGTLFVGSWDSYFYALDAATGKEKWRFKTGDDLDIHNQVGIQSSAAVADGVVYFGCRDSNFYAVDASPVNSAGPSPTRDPGSFPRPLCSTAESTSALRILASFTRSTLNLEHPSFPSTSNIGRCSLHLQLLAAPCTLAPIKASCSLSTSNCRKSPGPSRRIISRRIALRISSPTAPPTTRLHSPTSFMTT